MSSARPTTAVKLAGLETGMQNLTGKVETFVQDSKEYRDFMAQETRDNRRTQIEEQTKIWTELRAQGDRFNTALEKLGSRGAITWPLILMTAGFVLTVVGTAATLGHFFVETRVKQLEIADRYLERDIVRQEIYIDRLREGK